MAVPPGTATPNLIPYMDDSSKTPPGNIDLPESVKREADRLADDPDLMLRLVDMLFFLDDRKDIPS